MPDRQAVEVLKHNEVFELPPCALRGPVFISPALQRERLHQERLSTKFLLHNQTCSNITGQSPYSQLPFLPRQLPCIAEYCVYIHKLIPTYIHVDIPTHVTPYVSRDATPYDNSEGREGVCPPTKDQGNFDEECRMCDCYVCEPAGTGWLAGCRKQISPTPLLGTMMTMDGWVWVFFVCVCVCVCSQVGDAWRDVR